MTDAALREVWRGRVWRIVSCRIVEDTPGRVVLWLPRGSPGKYAARPDGSEIRIPTDEWVLADRAASRDALAVFRPGGRHSIWHFWRDDGSLDHWYVNFEQPLRRTAIGFDFVDEKLDLIVEPSGDWRWKDEDELDQAARLGLVDADEVRAEAERVLSEWPFPTGWEEWRPDPDWEVPQLPLGWDAV